MKTKKKILIGIASSLVLASVIIGAKKIILPLAGKLTSKFGNRKNPLTGATQFHNGIDISAPVGTVVKSPANGKILSVYYGDQGGKQMVIKHDNGLTTGYAHLDKYLVDKGDTVKAGQPIANVGMTGAVTGAHLHFTVKDKSGEYVDPLKYFSKKQLTIA